MNLPETQATTYASQQAHGNIVQEEGEQSISFLTSMINGDIVGVVISVML